MCIRDRDGTEEKIPENKFLVTALCVHCECVHCDQWSVLVVVSWWCIVTRRWRRSSSVQRQTTRQRQDRLWRTTTLLLFTAGLSITRYSDVIGDVTTRDSSDVPRHGWRHRLYGGEASARLGPSSAEVLLVRAHCTSLNVRGSLSVALSSNWCLVLIIDDISLCCKDWCIEMYKWHWANVFRDSIQIHFVDDTVQPCRSVIEF